MNNSEKINALITELSGKNEFSEQSDLKKEIGLNSLSMVMLLIRLEEVFDIVLGETDLNPAELNTVGDVGALVDKYTGAQ